MDVCNKDFDIYIILVIAFVNFSISNHLEDGVG